MEDSRALSQAYSYSHHSYRRVVYPRPEGFLACRPGQITLYSFPHIPVKISPCPGDFNFWVSSEFAPDFSIPPLPFLHSPSLSPSISLSLLTSLSLFIMSNHYPQPTSSPHRAKALLQNENLILCSRKYLGDSPLLLRLFKPFPCFARFHIIWLLTHDPSFSPQEAILPYTGLWCLWSLFLDRRSHSTHPSPCSAHANSCIPSKP